MVKQIFIHYLIQSLLSHKCIITWFRAGRNNCPCCGDQGKFKKNTQPQFGVVYISGINYKSDPDFKLKRDLYK